MITKSEIRTAAKAVATKICTSDDYEDTGLDRADIERLTETIEAELIRSLAYLIL